MSYLLIVAIFTVDNGWIVRRDVDEIPMRDLPACEAMRKEISGKMVEKGAQFYAICRPATHLRST